MFAVLAPVVYSGVHSVVVSAEALSVAAAAAVCRHTQAWAVRVHSTSSERADGLEWVLTVTQLKWLTDPDWLTDKLIKWLCGLSVIPEAAVCELSQVCERWPATAACSVVCCPVKVKQSRQTRRRAALTERAASRVSLPTAPILTRWLRAACRRRAVLLLLLWLWSLDSYLLSSLENSSNQAVWLVDSCDVITLFVTTQEPRMTKWVNEKWQKEFWKKRNQNEFYQLNVIDSWHWHNHILQAIRSPFHSSTTLFIQFTFHSYIFIVCKYLRQVGLDMCGCLIWAASLISTWAIKQTSLRHWFVAATCSIEDNRFLQWRTCNQQM